jgi:hypothetical protein
MDKVNLREKLALFSDHWNPRVVGELNGQHVKVVKFQGEFVWQTMLGRTSSSWSCEAASE